MPQMASIFWMLMFLFFTMIMILISSKIFFTQSPNLLNKNVNKNHMHKHPKKIFNWQW